MRSALFLASAGLLAASCGGGAAGVVAATSGGKGGEGQRPSPRVALSASGLVSNLVSLRIELIDPLHPEDGSRAPPDTRIRIFPEFESGETWYPMTPASHPENEGSRGLALGSHTFVWNSLVDITTEKPFESKLRVRAEYEATTPDSRSFRPGELSVRIDQRLGATLLGGPLDRDAGVETVPVDLRGEGPAFVVACTGSNIIEGTNSAGVVERLAGVGFAGSTVPPEGHPGTVRLPGITGVAVDAAGNLYSTHGDSILVTNRGDQPLRLGSVVVSAHSVAPVLVGLEGALCPRFHPSGVLLWIDSDEGRTRVAAWNPLDPGNPGASPIVLGGASVDPGAVVTLAGGGEDSSDGASLLDADLSGTLALAVGSNGEVFLGGDYPGARESGFVRLANVAGAPATLAGVTVDPGTVATLAGAADQTFPGDGGPALSARLLRVRSLESTRDGGLLVVDGWDPLDPKGGHLRLVNLGNAPLDFAGTVVEPGEIDTVAGGGQDQPGGAAERLALGDTRAVAMDGAGLCLVTSGRQVVVVNPGTSTVDSYGRLIRAGRSEVVYDASVRGGLPLQGPRAVHLPFPKAEEVLMTDRSTVRVLNLAPVILNYGGVSVLPGQPGVIGGGSVEGFAGDGGPAREAAFSRPSGLATLVPVTNAIRRDLPPQILFVADTGNDRVRAIFLGNPILDPPRDAMGVSISPGHVETIAGGGTDSLPDDGDGLAPTSASLSRPEGIAAALKHLGGEDQYLLFVADTGHHRIRVVNPGPDPVTLGGVTVESGAIRTLVGNGAPGFSPDGPGPWSIDTPTAIAVYQDILYFAESGNARIRAVNLRSTPETLAQVLLPPGEMRTLAGTGIRGSGGDGDLGSLVDIDDPRALDLHTLKAEPIALYFSDRAQHLVRVLNLYNDKDLTIAKDESGEKPIATVAPGSLKTVAGTPGRSGSEGDGEEPARMRFSAPWGIAWAAKNSHPGAFFVADEGNSRLRVFGAPPDRPGSSDP